MRTANAATTERPVRQRAWARGKSSARHPRSRPSFGDPEPTVSCHDGVMFVLRLEVRCRHIDGGASTTRLLVESLSIRLLELL